MIFKHRHILRTALLAIPLCLIVSAVGMTQGKTEVGDESVTKSDSAGTGDSGGEYDPGGFGAFSGENTERLIQSKNIMVSWSKDNDELRGFSQRTGEWTNLKIEKQEKLVPVVSTDVAAVRVGDTMAAYSGTTGTWDVLKLSNNSEAQPVVHAQHIQTTDNDYLYTFAASKGKWTSPNDPNFRAPENENADSDGLSYILPRPVTYLERTRLKRAQLNPLDAEAMQIAQKYRGQGLDNKEAREALTEVVEKAFDNRQKHQKAEADRLAEKLKKIQEAIEKRETLREKIIQRRVDELLDPNVEWESAFPKSGSSSYGTSPIRVEGPAKLVYPSTSR